MKPYSLAFRTLLLAATATLYIAQTQAAPIVGQTVRIDGLLSGVSVTNSGNVTVVDPGIEWNGGTFTVDVSGTNVVISLIPAAAFVSNVSFTVTDVLGMIDPFSSLSFVSGAAFQSVSFTDDVLRMNLTGVSSSANGASWNFAFNTRSTAVPEPASLALLGLGLAGLALSRRKIV